MKLGRIILALAVFGSASCDGYQIHYVIPFERVFPFDLDSQQSLAASATLTRSQIVGAIRIPEGATVTSVSLERMSLSVGAAAGNAATGATFGLQYDELPDPPGPDVFANNIVIPVGAPVETSLGITSPGLAGRFDSNLRDMLIQGSPSSISVILLTTSRTPSNARLHNSGFVLIKGSVNVAQCADLPGIGIGPEPNCVRG
jgi:hypothetical protein